VTSSPSTFTASKQDAASRYRRYGKIVNSTTYYPKEPPKK